MAAALDKSSDSSQQHQGVLDYSDYVDHETSPARRERTLTEKGFEWQFNTANKNFKAAVSSWRRQAIAMELLLSEEGILPIKQ